MPPDQPCSLPRNAAGDAVWSDPTASPFFPDSAAVNFDAGWRPVAAVPSPTPARGAVAPTSTSSPSPSSGVPSESAPTPTPAAAPAAVQPTPTSGAPWSRIDTYAAGQLVAPAAEPARRTVPAGRRNEPSAAYQPVTVYRSTPGTLTPPTLDQIRAQQRADGVAPSRSLLTRAFDAVRKLSR